MEIRRFSRPWHLENPKKPFDLSVSSGASEPIIDINVGCGTASHQQQGAEHQNSDQFDDSWYGFHFSSVTPGKPVSLPLLASIPPARYLFHTLYVVCCQLSTLIHHPGIISPADGILIR
jgi:hypothetical protein